MYRVSIKIERLQVVARRAVQVDEATPELLVQAKGSTVSDAIARAVRVLGLEKKAIEESTIVQADHDDEEDED
jgi:hypothetical protein